MEPKASLYMHELERKYGDVFAIREHLEEYYRKDLGDEFEKYVIDYCETHPDEMREIREEQEKKIRAATRQIYRFVGKVFASAVLLSPTVLTFSLYSSYKTGWLFAIFSFFFFLDIAVLLDAYLKRNFPDEKLGFMAGSLGLLLWGFLILCYYLYISQNPWTLYWATVLLWLGSSIGLTGYLEKKMNRMNAATIGLTMSGLPSYVILWYIYKSGADLMLFVFYFFIPYITLIPLLSFLTSILQIGKNLDRIMRNDVSLYLLFLLLVLLLFYLIYLTFDGLQWVIGILLFQRILSYVLGRNRNESPENAPPHSVVTWGAALVLSMALFTFQQSTIFLMPFYIALAFTFYYLFRCRGMQAST